MWVSCCVVLWCLVWSVCCDSGVACLAWPASWNLELGFCNCGTQEDDRERERELAFTSAATNGYTSTLAVERKTDTREKTHFPSSSVVGVVGGGFVWAVSMAPALHCREPKCTLRHGHFLLGGGCEKKEEEAVVLSVELAADDQRLVELLDLCLS
ncbi:unnamed protein product [Sphagnum jensenii]|uniref:Secreted protein n=1 Tax=Sphagnum jensenii TaxID=128206 RepID=A0ABP1BME7_9BRYO